MSTILIKNAIIIDPNSNYKNLKKDILIVDGIIDNIEKNIKADNAEIIKSDDLHVCPGLFDFSVDFPEPGNEQKETLKSGFISSISGGFTGLGLQPSKQTPRDQKTDILFCINSGKGLGLNVIPYGALSKGLNGEQLSEMFDMYTSGSLAFTDNMEPVVNGGLFSRAILYAKNFNGLIISFPYDQSISPSGQINEGIVSTQLGLEGIPELSEEIILSRDLLINSYHEGRLHFNILSSKNTVKQLEKAKKVQKHISCGTSIYHLLFDDEVLQGFNSRFKILPPLRTKEDRNALLEGIKNGVIDVITSYHQPHEEEINEVEFSLSPFGVIGTQICFPLAITYLSDYLGLEKIVQCMSINPRTILQCEVPIIKVGHKADITLFDPAKKWIYNRENNNSKSENTPLFGSELKASVLGTILGRNYHKNITQE